MRHFIGQIDLPRGEGLAWWAAERREPAFVPEDLLADPRVKYVPELEEEHFQSLLSVPIVGTDGGVIGVISAHTEAPREFSADEVEFVVTAHRLSRARSKMPASTARCGVASHELEALTELAEAIARTEALEELLPAVAAGARRLLEAEACHVYLIERGRDDLRLRRSYPPRIGSRARHRARRARPGALDPGAARTRRRAARRRRRAARPDRRRRDAAGRARARDRRTGGRGDQEDRLIERLTEKNLIKDFFEQLRGRPVSGPSSTVARRGSAATSHQPHIVLMAEPPDERLESALAAELPGTLVHRRDDSIRALVPVPTRRRGGS